MCFGHYPPWNQQFSPRNGSVGSLLSHWGFGQYFQGAKHVQFQYTRKPSAQLASLVTPRWSRWVLHSQQVRRGWELDGSLFGQFLAPAPSFRERIHIPPGEKEHDLQWFLPKGYHSFKECSFFTATYCHWCWFFLDSASTCIFTHAPYNALKHRNPYMDCLVG